MQASNGAPETKAFETSAKQFGILTLQQMSGSTGHKLRRTVADLQQILGRWDRLTADGDIHTDDLDAESQQDLLLLSGTAAFEPVLRLLPDIFAKYYKCLELAKQWWVLAHEIYPELPINRPPTPPATRTSSRESGNGTAASEAGSDPAQSAVNEAPEGKVPFSEQLHKVEEGIEVKEKLMQSLVEELKLLEERERHFQSLVEAYGNVTAQLEEKTKERKELVTVREKETFPPNNQLLQAVKPEEQTAPAERKTYDSAQELNEQVHRTEREIQLLQFQQSLLLQDYMLQLEIRPSLIRFADDLRLRTQEAQQSLTEQKMEKVKLETLLREESNTAHSETGARTPQQDVNGEDRNSAETQPQAPSASSKAVERKLELSRLQTRPFREDTSASNATLERESGKLPAPKREIRKSHPERQKEEVGKDRRSPPLIKISDAVGGRPASPIDNNNSQSFKKKSARVPTIQSSGAAKPSQRAPHPKAPAAAAAETTATETLFQRRASRKQSGAETTAGKPDKDQADHPEPRPRARSDPHAVKPGRRALKLLPEPARRFSTAELNPSHSQQGGQQQHGKTNSTGSSFPNPKPMDDVRENADTAATQRVRPGDVSRESDASQKAKTRDVRKESDTSQKSKPGDVRKESDTSQKTKPRDVRKESDTSQKSKPGDVRKESDTSQKAKPGDVRKESDASQKAKPGDFRKESDTSHKSKPREVRKESDTSQKTKPDDVRRESDTSQKAKPDGVRREIDTSQKAKPGDSGKESDVSQRSKPGDVRKDADPTSKKSRPDDVRQSTDATSHKSKSVDIKNDTVATSHNSSTGDVKKDSDYTSRKSIQSDVRKDTDKMSQNPKLNGPRKDTQVASQKPHRKQGEKTNTDTPSANPKENHDKSQAEVTSHKTRQGDASKNGSLTSQKANHGDDKKHSGAPLPGQKTTDTRQHPRATDVRKTVDVTSQKASSTGRGHDTVSYPNGVIGRGKKHNYSNV